jgi:FKBP-type peptidyl-prolyl cis-trans isomerase 2
MAEAKSGDTVKVHFTGRIKEGAEFDSSRGGDPMEFTIGSNQVAPGFEAAVIGMQAGESKTFLVEAKHAYGPYIDGLVQEVDRDKVHADVEVGQKLEIHRPDGTAIIVTVKAATESMLTLDANHPLAGKDLEFDVELLEIA